VLNKKPLRGFESLLRGFVSAPFGTFVSFLTPKRWIYELLETFIPQWKLESNPFSKTCVSLAIMSPLTAKVKCPHYGRQSEFEAEAVEKVASS
jgi:hypothetical protein